MVSEINGETFTVKVMEKSQYYIFAKLYNTEPPMSATSNSQSD